MPRRLVDHPTGSGRRLAIPLILSHSSFLVAAMLLVLGAVLCFIDAGKTREMICVLDNYFLDPRPKVPIFPKDSALQCQTDCSEVHASTQKATPTLQCKGASLPELLHGAASLAQSVPGSLSRFILSYQATRALLERYRDFFACLRPSLVSLPLLGTLGLMSCQAAGCR